MKYSEDPLLKSSKLILAGDTLNVYSALIKKEDFEGSRSLNSIAYVSGKIFNKIKPLLSEHIIKKLEYYMQQKILKCTVKNWIEKEILPLPLLRVIALEYKYPDEKLNKYVLQIDKITNCSKSAELKLPLRFDELLQDNIIYFYGYLLGDGCISKDAIIKLCDGHSRRELVIYSEEHLTAIKNFLKDEFNLYSKLTRTDNKCELVLVSKPLSRFFKFFYGFKKDKGIITKPTIIKDNYEQSCIFYRGFFDADAGLKVKDKYLTLKCKDTMFLRLCITDFKKYGINVSSISYDNHNTSFFKIYSHNLFNFAKCIGFSHPRKQKDLIFHLKKGCSIKKLDSLNVKRLYGDYYDLRKMKGLRIKGLSAVFKMYRKKIGTQQKASHLLCTARENIKRWENDVASIPLEYYLQLMKLNKITVSECFSTLQKKDIVFGQGTLQQYVNLPISLSEQKVDVFQYLIPKKNKVLIKSYGVDDRDLDKTKLFNEIEVLFNVKIVKDSSSNIICSNTLSSFLSTFYIYNPSWAELNDKEINKLIEKWVGLA